MMMRWMNLWAHGDEEKAESAEQQPAVANPQARACSTTHPIDWKQFIRLVNNRDKFPVSLAAAYKTSRLDLFKLLLENTKDVVHKVEILIKRRVENEKEAETGWVLLKRRDILKGFDGNVEKTDKIIAKRTQQGKWAKDDDFPDDEEEH